ncbi:MAG: 2OG-Fe(II) oxygenase [Alphaproteobacteria bacterium]
MSLLDFDALRRTPLKTDPYEYVVVPQFVIPDAFPRVLADFPVTRGAGSFPVGDLDISGAMQDLLDEMSGPEFRAAIEDKFGVDLSSRPTTFTVRGWCSRSRDGNVHTDSKSKIITVLLYLNQTWDADGGRLRILRSKNLNDVAEEVPPSNGTLLVFKRSDKSLHGHERFEGVRRVIQMNWVTDDEVAERQRRKHSLSALIKRLNPFAQQAM